MPRKGYRQNPEHVEKRRKLLRERWEALTEEEREGHRRMMREWYHDMYGPPKTKEERRAANAERMRRKRAAARNPHIEDRRAKRDAIIAAARPILEKAERARREAEAAAKGPYGYVRKERKL